MPVVAEEDSGEIATMAKAQMGWCKARLCHSHYDGLRTAQTDRLE